MNFAFLQILTIHLKTKKTSACNVRQCMPRIIYLFNEKNNHKVLKFKLFKVKY